MTSYAHAYLSHSGRGTVLAATAVNDAGIRYEPDYAVLLLASFSPESVGQAVMDVLGRFCRKDRNLRSLKKSEWPAFRASGLKSVRAFEQDYSYVAVEHDERRLTLTRFQGSHAAADTVHLPADSSAEAIGSGLMQLADRAGFKRNAELGAAPNCGPPTSVASSRITKGPQSVT